MPTAQITGVLNLEILPEKQDQTWSMFDDGGCEVEVGEYLYGLVRAKKPRFILETGLYSAISCMYMALGLRDNGFGHLDTVEYESAHIRRSKERLIKMRLQDFVTIHKMSSLEFETPQKYDLIFLDTEPEIRFKELVRYYHNLQPGGFIFIHDLPRSLSQNTHNPDHPDYKHWPFGALPDQIKDWVVNKELSIFHIGSARGLVGFYKRHPDDYLI